MAIVSDAELLQGCRNAFWWYVWFTTVQMKLLGLTSLWLCLGSCLVSRAVGCAELLSAFPPSLHLRSYSVFFSDSIQEQEPQWKCRPDCNAFTNVSTDKPVDFSPMVLHQSLIFASAGLLCFSLLCMSLLSNSSRLADQSCTPLLLMRCRDVSELWASQSIFLLSLCLM